MSKVGVVSTNVDHRGGGNVIADLDTRCEAGYAPGDEVLPGALELERDVLRASQTDAFACSRERFEDTVTWLDGQDAAGLAHGELEARLELDARELYRLLLQDHLDLRAQREIRIEQVACADRVRRGCVEAGHRRRLATVFGEVGVSRIAYRARGRENLCPADALLNLPVEKHSHGLRRLAAIESARGSYDDTVAAIERATGQVVAKRQVELLAQRAAVDFDGFYAARCATVDPGDAVIMSCDGKGVVMRHDALRPQTRRQAHNASPKLKTRLSKGEKRNRKRMAEVGAVYDITPASRTAADVMPADDAQRAAAIAAPAAKNKWLTASVVDDAASVVGALFDEADRRDPRHCRDRVALVDGNNHQISRISAEACARDVNVTIVCDFIHVLEYVWKAAWSFHKEGDPAAELWVRGHAQQILTGHATKVAGQIRRQATNAGLDPMARAGADKCAAYLTNKQAYLDYPTALANGWPIATGVIEGACRHLVKDRMDITGARWGLDGAEAILKLRAIRSNGDLDDYWRYHLTQEHRRVHQSRYADHYVPRSA
ncbi:MAG: ISKra4 family transposase [Actinobacteria bacterium]|nr:ISKra4 family transposase [Actinomycetota bacterium]